MNAAVKSAGPMLIAECKFNGEDYEVPPKEMLVEAVLKAVLCEREEACAGNSYDVPENLEHFFEGKNKKYCCCDEGDC